MARTFPQARITLPVWRSVVPGIAGYRVAVLPAILLSCQSVWAAVDPS
jgi:hypothetical protein